MIPQSLNHKITQSPHDNINQLLRNNDNSHDLPAVNVLSNFFLGLSLLPDFVFARAYRDPDATSQLSVHLNRYLQLLFGGEGGIIRRPVYPQNRAGVA
jgi:hypothetical protein